MLALFALFAVANAFVPFDQEQLWHTSRQPWLSPGQFGLRSPFFNTRDRFLGLTGLHYGQPSFYGTQFTTTTGQDCDFIKAKLARGAPIDQLDFELVKQQIAFVPEHHIDEIELLIKQKISHGVPVQRFEGAILKECVKAKVARGLPIDKLESEVLKNVVKAKIMIGLPVDRLEAKICTNNIKNKLVKGEPCDPLELEVVIDFVKNKVARNKPLTNLESEVIVEALKQKMVMGLPIDPVEGEVLIECIKNRANRGSPISRTDEELVLSVLKRKLTTGHLPTDKHELDLCHEIVKNKLERGEHIDQLEQQCLSVVPYRTQLTAMSKNLLQSEYGHAAVHGIGFGLNQQWNRCPTTGFYDIIGSGFYNTHSLRTPSLWNYQRTYPTTTFGYPTPAYQNY